MSIESCPNAAESSAFVDCSDASPAVSVAVAVAAMSAAAGLPHSQPSVLESTDLTVPNTPRGCEADEDEDEDEAPADGFALVSRRTYG